MNGATLAIDAMGCQKEIARTIAGQGADYVLALRDNHAKPHGEVKLLKARYGNPDHKIGEETTSGLYGQTIRATMRPGSKRHS